MGFNISDVVAKLISKVEASQEEGITQDGKISNEKERSIFAGELEKMNLKEEEVKEIWGFVDSGKAAAPAKMNTRSTNNINIGGDTTIINLTINIKNDFESALNAFLESGKIDAIIEALFKHMDELGSNILNGLIKFLGESFAAFFENDAQIMELLKAILEKLGLVEENGNDLNDKVDTLTEAMTKYAEEIIERLSKFGIDISALLDELKKNNEYQDKQIVMMTLIANAIDKLVRQGQDNIALLNTIIGMLSSGQASLDQILALLEGIKKDTSENCQVSKQILEVVTKLGAEFMEFAADIMAMFNEGKVSLEEITELLKGIKEDTSENNELSKKILEAISKLGADVMGLGTEILNQLKNGNENITNIIMDFFDKLIENDNNNTKAILEALANIKIEGGSGNIDLSSLMDMLQKLLDESKKQTGLLESIDGKLDIVNLSLQAIEDKIKNLTDITVENNESLTQIFDFIKNNYESYDDSELLKMLSDLTKLLNEKFDELMELIKDHEVHVTVDVTGEVHCDCDCGKDDDGNHEGILDDLENIFNAPRRGNSGIGDVTADAAKPKSEKVRLGSNNEFGLPAGMYVVVTQGDNKEVYNLSGVKVK